MNLTRLALGAAIVGVLAGARPAALDAQDPASPEARVKTFFRAFDLNEDGWLSGRELVACECAGYDANRDAEITWAEFRSGWARAPLFGGGAAATAAARGAPSGTAAARAPAAAAERPSPTAPTAAVRGRYDIGSRVEVDVGGTWHPATIVNVQNGRYRVSRDDHAYGVTTSEEWISADRLRPLVAKPAAATPPATTLPASVPVGVYDCVTYGGGMQVGKLRILSAGVSSGVTPDGSGAQHRYTYDAGSGAITWVGGLQIVGFTVERAEYRPGTTGRPSINLHYRRQAGGNLNSMSCMRQ